jgi:hypothetical protein
MQRSSSGNHEEALLNTAITPKFEFILGGASPKAQPSEFSFAHGGINYGENTDRSKQNKDIPQEF